MQASALRLQQEVRERESELEQAYTRLQEGEAPTEDAAQHWNRTMRTQALRKQEEETRKAVSEREGMGEGRGTQGETRKTVSGREEMGRGDKQGCEGER